jgi:hypothetical protein
VLRVKLQHLRVNHYYLLTMSSISFPHNSSSDSSPSPHDSSFYPPFDSNSSFQMNPHSSHPPRTPRTSIISSGSNVYGTSIYETNEVEQEKPLEVEDELEDEEDDKGKALEARVRKEDVWREMLLTSNGRDKAFVC